MNFRMEQMHRWLKSIFQKDDYELEPLVGDASFRQYYRIRQGDKTWMLMDADPVKEKPDVFFDVASIMNNHQLNVPECLAFEKDFGFMLMTDFGDQQLFQVQDKNLKSVLYEVAISNIFDFVKVDANTVPPYEHSKFCSEVDLLVEWFYPFIGYAPTEDEKNFFLEVRNLLANICTVQPQVFLHRDYHSKNLMVLNDQDLGLIDFQDAVKGPITYDLVSLLRDCYVSFDEAYIQKQCRFVYQGLAPYLKNISEQEFKRWFDWTGLQRHLKCLGIFTRLELRDGREDYLKHLPRVVGYIEDVLAAYEAFAEFDQVWRQKIKPCFDKKSNKIKML
ncbi:phosphotransferase [Francisellaceae bacterium]|nr:phosphotransferase [Francisellaceae bacterium]